MSNIVQPSTFVKTVLQNGVGRYVCQLKRMTIKFSKSHGGSCGLREFIEKDLLDFAKSNPGVVVYLKPRRIGPPSITAEYLNGHTHYKSFPKRAKDDIVKWVEFIRTQSGFPIARFIKNQHTDNPSIQGVWTPFTNKPTALNITEFPDPKLSATKTFWPTATEQLIEVARTFGTSEEKIEEEPRSSKSQN